MLSRRTRCGLVALTTIGALSACTHALDGKAPSSAVSKKSTTTVHLTSPSPSSSPLPPPTSSPTSAPPPPSSTSRPAATAPPTPLNPFYGREWTRLPTRRDVVALTFDAGGDAAGVPSIVATLRREHVSATFFLTGNWVQHFPAQARAIATTARVADHSQTHPHFTELSSAQIRVEVLDSANVIERICRADPAPLFRFPYGDRNQRTIDAVNAAGYLPIGWTVDTLGWKGTRAGITVTTIVARVLADAQPGEIVLMHVGANPDDRSTLDADALPEVIARLRAHGYGFVSLDALLTMKP
jgi:peptidoglycan-N-acetylglucosamine deacetylase